MPRGSVGAASPLPSGREVLEFSMPHWSNEFMPGSMAQENMREEVGNGFDLGRVFKDMTVRKYTSLALKMWLV